MSSNSAAGAAFPTPSPEPVSAVPAGVVHDHCLHCGLPVPKGRRRRGDRFCCAGCARVHALIEEGGLGRYYELRRGPGAPPTPSSPGDFPWLDALLAADAAPERATGGGAVTADPGGPTGPGSVTLDVQGIHCSGCVWILDTLFRRHDAALSLTVNPAIGRAELAWDFSRGDLREWLRQAEAFGYRFGPPHKTADRGSRDLLVRLGITAAAAMNVMVFSLCYYLGLGPEDGPLYVVLGRVSLALTAVAVGVGGWTFFRAALEGLRRGVAHLDLPIATGLLLAFGGSVAAYLRRGPEGAYFDTVSAFAALMLVGRWLRERILERNRAALLADAGASDLTVRRLEDGILTPVPAAAIRPGDELWVTPGEAVPVAGRALEDGGGLRLDWITGEADEREALAGATVPAGAINAGDAVLRVEAAETFADSRLADLLERAPREAAVSSGGWRGRLGALYVGGVFLLAAAGFALWVPRGLDRGLAVALSILVVTCPCAFGLAVPLAHELTHLGLRRRGIFVRRGDFFERAPGLDTLVFDKTGTLTLGSLLLDPPSRSALASLPRGEREVLTDLVARSRHPASRALARALVTAGEGDGPGSPRGWAVRADARVREVPGAGIETERDGVRYRLGKRGFAGTPNPDQAGGSTAETVFAAADRVIAPFRFQEEIREDAAEELSRLSAEGYAIYLLSGDAPARAAAVGARLGIPAGHVEGGLTPEEKAAWLRRGPGGRALMVGDGLNDAPALDAARAAATPAVAHPAVPARVDFYFLGEEIGAVRRALAASRRLRSVVRGNLVLAGIYNAAALALSLSGVVTPLVAAVLMPLSSAAIVTITAFRLSPRRAAWTS